MKRLGKVLATILEGVTPEADERAKMNRLAQKLKRSVASASKRLGVKATVRVEGSMAKDTWLSKELDIDVFMRVPRSVPREALGDVCLRVAREATKGSLQIERFAEHPYLEALVDGVRVNIVPCYTTKRGEWLSATDRTPFHTDYVNGRLNEEMRGEVRLLKKFMKGVGVYGAEIKVGGFSGYLCELLVLHYRSFVGALEAFTENKERIIVDIENYYEKRVDELALLFREPLVIIDPVDKGRNVASAVHAQRLCSFVAAAQAFLKDPDTRFFYPQRTAALSVGEMRRKLMSRGSAMVFVVFKSAKTVPDVLWGQLFKSQRSLRKLVQLNDFRILRDVAWSDEKGLNVFVFEFEECCLPPVRKHLGPPLERHSECEKFIAKYLSSPSVVCGPYVEDGRWVVQVRRIFADACCLLEEKLKSGGRDAGVAEGLSHALRKGFAVFVNEEVVEICSESEEFAVFLTEFLDGRPKWLERRSG